MNISYECGKCHKPFRVPVYCCTATGVCTTRPMGNSSGYTYEMWCHCKQPKARVIVDEVLVFESTEPAAVKEDAPEVKT